MTMKHLPLLLVLLLTSGLASAQETEIRGFAHVSTRVNEDEVSFFLGEQDLFITSEISDRISFLGETVFRFSPLSPTTFNISVERIIIKYNLKGNHNILFGKHHTPISYWNDNYHHGRVFFPTVERPLLFAEHIVMLHTTGIGLQGLNLGKWNFGYNVMVGNGMGSTDWRDDNFHKSVQAEVHIRPLLGMKIGLSSYYDHYEAEVPLDTLLFRDVEFDQWMNGAYFAWFGPKVEVLAEGYLMNQWTDSTGQATNGGFYVYAGVKPWKKLVPYARYDYVSYAPNELHLGPVDKQQVALGLRHEFNYLAVAKLEYNYLMLEGDLEPQHGLLFQFAVGF